MAIENGMKPAATQVAATSGTPAVDVAAASHPAATVAALLKQAADHHRAGDLGRAEAGYNAILAAEPHNADALHLLGVVRRARGEPERAIELMRQAIDLGVDTADAWSNLANAYRDAGRFQAEVEALDTAIARGRDPASATARLVTALVKAAEAAVAARRGAEARALLERAAKLRPNRAEILDQLLPVVADTDRVEALEIAERAWRLSPDPIRWRNLWELSQWAGSDLGVARTHVAAHPNRPLIAIAEANALRREGQGRAAEAVYRKVMAAVPDQVFAAGRLAILLLSQGRTEEADRLLRSTDDAMPGRMDAMHFSRAFHLGLRDRPLPPAPTFVRRPGRVGDTVIFAGCDGVYFDRYASALLHSATVMSGLKPSFHLHVVDPPADIEARIADWDERLGRPGIGLTVEHTDLAGAEHETRITTYACARFRILPALMARYGRPILMLDTDLIVLRDLQGFVAELAEGDFAAVSVDHARFEPWNWYWADVLHFAATPAAMNLAERVARYCDHFLALGRPRWFLDQIAITAALHVPLDGEPRPRVVRIPSDVHRLSIEYVDGRDKEPPETVLFWSAHASTVKASYTVETERYASWLLT